MDDIPIPSFMKEMFEHQHMSKNEMEWVNHMFEIQMREEFKPKQDEIQPETEQDANDVSNQPEHKMNKDIVCYIEMNTLHRQLLISAMAVIMQRPPNQNYSRQFSSWCM